MASRLSHQFAMDATSSLDVPTSVSAMSPLSLEGGTSSTDRNNKSSNRRCRRLSCSRKLCCRCYAVCCCVTSFILLWLIVLAVGVLWPVLARSKFQLCNVNITESSSSFIGLQVDLGFYNPSFADIHIPRLGVSVVTGLRETDTIPLEDDYQTSVAYGALIACDVRDTTLFGSAVSPIMIRCAISQYASARTALNELVGSFVDGNSPPPVSIRYNVQVAVNGLPLTVADSIQLNLTDFLSRPRLDRPPPPPPPPPPPGRELCAGGAEDFDPLSILTGNSIGLPANFKEATTLIHICDLLLCAGDEWTSGDLQGGTEPYPPLASVARALPEASSSPGGCALALNDVLARHGVVSFRMLASAFNPLGLDIAINELAFALGEDPAAPVLRSTPNASVAHDRGATALAACRLTPEYAPLTLGPAAWTAMGLDCTFSPTIASLTTRYTAGETLSMTAVFNVDAAAFGISFARESSLGFEVSRAAIEELLADSNDDDDDDDEPYGPPTLPEGHAACGGFQAADLIAERASPQVEQTIDAYQFVLNEAGLNPS